MLQVVIRNPDGLLPEELAAWRAFQAATPSFASPLLSPEFAQMVGRARDDVGVAIFRDDGRVVGVFAHHRRPATFAGVLGRGLGGPWSDEQALLTGPQGIDWREALNAAGLRACRFTGLIDPHGVFAGSARDGEGSFAIAFEGKADDYLEGLRAESPKRFKNLRRLDSKLERERGVVTLEAPDHDPEALAQLLDWKRQQFQRTGVHDVLGPDWSRAMIADAFASRGGEVSGMMVSLRVGGQLVAGHFGLRSPTIYHPWIAAFDPDFAAYSPGITLISRAIRAMPGLGLTRYELSGGCGHYKAAFASEETPLREGLLEVRPAPRLPIARPVILERVRRRFDRIVETELTFAGRISGVSGALRDLPRRLPAHAAQRSEEA